MKLIYRALVYILVFTAALSAEEGIFAVISPRVVKTERPILWINRDSDNNDAELQYFKGPRYHFMGLVVSGKDTTGVITGQNTAGFALVFTTARDVAADTTVNITKLIKQALGSCASVKEFANMLQSAPANNAIFGCIDHYGGGAVFESNTSGVIAYHVDDQATAPLGYLVRQHFTMHGKGPVSLNTWRYHRADEILNIYASQHNLDIAQVMLDLARDVRSEDLAPYPLPFAGRYGDAPKHFVKAENTINSWRTTQCLVYFGHSQLNTNELPGMLYIPGQPLCGAAVPLWPLSGEIPSAVKGKGFTKIAHTVQSIENKIYRKNKWPAFFDSRMLARGEKSRLRRNLDAEQEMLGAITPLPVQDMTELAKFQKDQANRILRSIQ